MLIPTVEVKINPGRRTANPEHIQELAKSISEIGLLNPITVDHRNVLIAGLHRLEAAKLLDWPEIECTVSSLEGLQAELAEIDENFIRNGLSEVEYGELFTNRFIPRPGTAAIGKVRKSEVQNAYLIPQSRL